MKIIENRSSGNRPTLRVTYAHDGDNDHHRHGRRYGDELWQRTVCRGSIFADIKRAQTEQYRQADHNRDQENHKPGRRGDMAFQLKSLEAAPDLTQRFKHSNVDLLSMAPSTLPSPRSEAVRCTTSDSGVA